MKQPTPRISNYMGMKSHAVEIGNTWLEPEEFCYPNGGMTRRALVTCPDGKLRVVTCGIPDTYFSIPARVKIAGKTTKGFVTSDESGFKFNVYTS